MAQASLAPEPVCIERFHRLAAQWKAQRGPTSSVTDLVMHPAYQQIIGMGPAAVPWLLAELEHDPDHWFWALKSITMIDPVPAVDRGNLLKMADAWLNWGSEQGYRW